MSATYLNVGTEVVINQNGNNEWYTTQQQVQVEDYRVAVCPLRGVPVLTATVRGFRVWFLESQLHVEMSAELAQHAANLDLVTLEYDIPTEVSRTNRMPHPSQWMWSIGVRTTLSCWTLSRSRIPYSRLHEMLRHGCQYRVTRVHPDDASRQMQLAMISLRRELEDAASRREQNYTAAETRFSARGRELQESVNRYNADLSRIEKAYQTAVSNVEAGCKALGIPMTWLGSSYLQSFVRAERAILNRRIEAHVTVMDRLAAAGHAGVVTEVEAGRMPHVIAADYAEDHEVSTESVTEDGTYSLREAFDGE